MLGAAPAGSFHALCGDGRQATLVLGECAGETPSAALARAVAARRFFEAEPATAARVAQGEAAFALERVAWLAWSADAPPAAQALALLDGDGPERAAAYAARAEGLDPGAILDDLTALLRPDGVLAVVQPASAEGGEG